MSRPIPVAISDFIPKPAPAPVAPIAGSDTFGVPRGDYPPTRSGHATLAPVIDAAAPHLVAGELLLIETPTGLRVIHVARVRSGVAGDYGAEYETPVVDARFQDGVCLTYAPADLLDVALDDDADTSSTGGNRG